MDVHTKIMPKHDTEASQPVNDLPNLTTNKQVNGQTLFWN